MWNRGARSPVGVLALVGLGFSSAPMLADPVRSNPARPEGDIATKLLARPEVVEALRQVQRNEPALIEEQIRLCEIPAPPLKEEQRARAYEKAFNALGLKNVRIDREGNVLGERPGRLASGTGVTSPHVVFSAHLDTVFPEDTDVNVKRDGPILRGPGIGDNCRGLAVVLGVARALDAAKVTTVGTITFVGTVGEEGPGDLRGVKHLVRHELNGRIDAFVSVDGAGMEITDVGVASKRYRVTIKGPGGHSYGAFGMPNPIHALGRAIAAIGDIEVPSKPKTTFNVGVIGGGTSVNSIPFEAWFDVDMRSSDNQALARLDQRVRQSVASAIDAEHTRWSQKGVLTSELKVVGDRPAGRAAPESFIVRAAESATRALGLPVRRVEGSTDANLPMSAGIPAVTIDGGGSGSGSHSLDEAFDTTNSWKGTQRALLFALALAEGEPGGDQPPSR